MKKISELTIDEIEGRFPDVIFIDKDAVYIGDNVIIGSNTVIYPNVYLEKNVEIKNDCTIKPNTTIHDSSIGNSCMIDSSVIEESVVGDFTKIGPMAHLRPGTKIGDYCKIGNFVEVKASTLGNNVKASHLSYVGDAKLGNNINVGCGVVFVNYDGKNKHQTIIEDDVFIGSNSNLIAPITIRKNTYIAAGSTITDSTVEDDFAVARARQVIKKNWVRPYDKE